MTRDEIWARLRALWETTERSALALAHKSRPAWLKVQALWEARVARKPRLPDAIAPVVQPSVAPATPTPTRTEPVQRVPASASKAPRTRKGPEARLQQVAAARSKQRDEPRLAIIDEAIKRKDAMGAMRVLQPMVLHERIGSDVLKRAARVMRLLEEDDFAMLFDAAVASPAPGPAIDLASSFLAVDDAKMALAMSKLAIQRGGDDDPMVQALLAESHARLGDHDAVLRTLERFLGAWPEPTLVRRYALSALLSGDDERWGQVEDALADDPHAEWILEAATRYARYSEQGQGAESWYRDLLFTQYGALLLAEEIVDGQKIAAHEVVRVMDAAVDSLRELGAVPDRIAHVGTSGEVFAHWLGQALDVMVMPLSARIVDQTLLLVVADDAELERAFAEPCYREGPVMIFQVSKVPSYSGVPAADMIGFLAPYAPLPLEPVTASRAADRLPPRLMVAELKRRASAMLAIAEETEDSLTPWRDERREDLSLCAPKTPRLRPPFVADMTSAPPEDDEASEMEAAIAPDSATPSASSLGAALFAEVGVPQVDGDDALLGSERGVSQGECGDDYSGESEVAGLSEPLASVEASSPS